MKSLHHRCLPLVLLALVPCFSSCLIGSSTVEEKSGTYIGEQTFARVQPGDSMEFVRELFGPPSQEITTDAPNHVIWKWNYHHETRGDGSLFLVFHTRSSKRTDGSVFVEFEKGLVTESWRDWNVED